MRKFLFIFIFFVVSLSLFSYAYAQDLDGLDGLDGIEIPIDGGIDAVAEANPTTQSDILLKSLEAYNVIVAMISFTSGLCLAFFVHLKGIF